jgi:hypothetical protein
MTFKAGSNGEERYLPVDIVLIPQEKAVQLRMYVCYIYPEQGTVSFEDAVRSMSSLDSRLQVGCLLMPIDQFSVKQSIDAVQRGADPCSVLFMSMIRVIRWVYVHMHVRMYFDEEVRLGD